MQFSHTFRLSSIQEITDAAAQPLPPHTDTLRCKPRERSAMAWTGNATFSQAVELAANGWTDAPKLGELAERIAPTETRTSHEMQHAVTGACVDVSRYLEGHPECMLDFCDEPAPRTVSLAVQIGKLADVTPHEMELAGAVALAVIDTLSRSGFIVDLYGAAGNRSKTGETTALITFPIKRAHEPADENQIAFWLCHPAAFRSLIFNLRDIIYPIKLWNATAQHKNRGWSLAPTAAAAGVDYVIHCNPSTEYAAAKEYHRIITEITATL
jgi:hypothetical protein